MKYLLIVCALALPLVACKPDEESETKRKNFMVQATEVSRVKAEEQFPISGTVPPKDYAKRFRVRRHQTFRIPYQMATIHDYNGWPSEEMPKCAGDKQVMGCQMGGNCIINYDVSKCPDRTIFPEGVEFSVGEYTDKVELAPQ